MEIPLALVRRIARDLAAPVSVQFSPPGLFVFEDDSGTGVVQVSIDVHLETDDREATATFRRAFYESLGSQLESPELGRLSLFAWNG